MTNNFSFPYIYQNLAFMNKIYSLLLVVTLIAGCKKTEPQTSNSTIEEETAIQDFAEPVFTLEEANNLIDLPLHCVGTPYPYKPGHVLENKTDLVEPIDVHPVFYGCFDWHSAVHGYWSMVTLLKQFPEIDRANEVRNIDRKSVV